MAKAKVYSIQPRFKKGDMAAGWSIVDAIFKMGTDVPPYGATDRDTYLSAAWMNEPMTAGVFSTWVEKLQTVNWTITGGKTNARKCTQMLNDADKRAGFTYHLGCCALDYLTCDKGSMEELGRAQKSSDSRVLGIQHIDATRMVKMGKLDYRWRFYPDLGTPVDIPDYNIIQITSMPSGRDRWRGFGHSCMSRLLDAKQLMLGYLTYYRQEIGALPPELVVIINGLPATSVQDSLNKYKTDKAAAGLSEYGKIWWLGSDDPATPINLSVQGLTTPNKSFNYQTMVEWWAKMLALNTGEDVGEYWLIQQTGATKAVQSIQAMKSRGKGTARYFSEQETRYNADVMPVGVTFAYDNKDDDQDRAEAEILGTRIGNLKSMMAVGAEQQSFAFTAKEVRNLAVEWGIIESSEQSPVQMEEGQEEGGYQPGAAQGAMVPAGPGQPGGAGALTLPEGAFKSMEIVADLKRLAGRLSYLRNEQWVIDRWGHERRLEPITNNVRTKQDAESVFQMLSKVYLSRHHALVEVKL